MVALAESFAATAADGVTPIEVLVFKPSDYDPSRRYAIIDHEYGGPQVSSVPWGSFNCPSSAQTYVRSAALAELGFIVVLIDGRGTSDRDRRFHLESYGKLQDASNLDDHVEAIREIAAHDASLDLERIGIIGFSGGGFLAAHGILRYPEFYRVAVAGSGNYDNRIFWHTWGERYHGAGDEAHWRAQSAATYAKNLRGKLLLTHGLLDVGCHPAQVFELIEALQRENKDYDLIVFPNAAHELPGYGERRGWDYLVKHLNAMEPPTGISITTGHDLIMALVESRRHQSAEGQPMSAE